jgi:hypothetical protein
LKFSDIHMGNRAAAMARAAATACNDGDVAETPIAPVHGGDTRERVHESPTIPKPEVHP